MRKLFTILIGIIFTPFILYAGYGVTLVILGYELTGSPEKLVTMLLAEDRPAKNCFLFRTLDVLFRPTTRDLQNRCVYEYAELQKDPSACELLMPSSYGLSCTGAAKDFKRPCGLGNDRSVSGDGIDATLAECVRGAADKQNNRCCIIAKARFITSFNDCSDVNGNQDMKDQCYYSLAFKNHDPESCTSIQHENLRKACAVEASALKQDPSICSGCTQPLNDLSELE